jgi:mannose-6-phosphate isomerase
VTGSLRRRYVPKPWGREVLPPPFDGFTGERIGEIWFEPPTQLDQLLVKYIFTSERLSVQVHPSDEQAAISGVGGRGKEECWLVVATEGDAALGIGFRRAVSREELKTAVSDGTVEHLLEWHRVEPGDFFYIPANTVHAIGAGVSLVEIQQNSDITYRLYDYGRPRELHLEEGIAVADGSLYPRTLHLRVPSRGSVSLVQGPSFRVDRVSGDAPGLLHERYGDAPVLVVPLVDEVTIGSETLRQGECGLAPSVDQLLFGPESLCLLAQPLAS